MKDLFKPLLIYKKILLADKILKAVYINHAEIIKVNDKEVFIPGNGMRYRVDNFIHFNPKIDKYQLLDAINLLVYNDHIDIERNPNLYQVILIQNDKGRQAYNDGFYKNLAMKEFKRISIGIFSVLSVVSIMYFRKDIISLLQDLLHK